jgi:hypothetical protein
MPSKDDIKWFKEQFGAGIKPALAGTPLTLDFIVALACQETGHIWSTLRRKGMNVQQVLALCVGDTLDASAGRRAFPQTKDDLLAAPRGAEMFAIARQALVDMAQHIPGFSGVADKPNKFCHGFGLFQLDLQFFKHDPQYFLEKRYERFDETLRKCLEELKRALRKLGFDARESLSDEELAAVGIAYNTGRFRPNKGLKQGHQNASGKFYGEQIFDFLRLSKTVAAGNEAPALPPAQPGQAILPPPTPVTANGPFFKVETRVDALRLRSEPKKSDANIIAKLPDGHPVRAVTGTAVNGFMEIETSLAGALLRGFCAAEFLKPDPQATEVPVVEPAARPPRTGIVAVGLPAGQGAGAKRTQNATALSLKEEGQPGRRGGTPDELRAEIAAIVNWLAVDKASHKRYQPRDGLTFCNIYSHDFCHLAGAYLPRVWWNEPALIALSHGETVAPLINNTLREMRANDLFRWLRDFGPDFGWRQTGTLSKLQQAANQGAVGLIVARRKEDGRSGHIVPVVPETGEHRAKRDASGEVTAPLQSQAGRTNFRYGTNSANWWLGQEFAESAFWVHA